jgi:excisionase family DNA binding protein
VQGLEVVLSGQGLPGFLTVPATAALLGVSEMTVRRAFDAGRLPGFRLGRVCRISRAFVRALVAEVEAGRQIDVADYAAAWPGTDQLDGPGRRS